MLDAENTPAARRRALIIWFTIAVIVIIADQWTKQLALGYFQNGGTVQVTSFLNLVLAFNTGAAWSMFAGGGGWQQVFFVAIAIAATAFIIYMLINHWHERLFAFGLAMIMGGALGNLWDRLTLGKVVDFIAVHSFMPFQHWTTAWLDPFPVFNIADSAITCGAVALIIDSFRPSRLRAARVAK